MRLLSMFVLLGSVLAGAVVATAPARAATERRDDLAELLAARPRIAERGERLAVAMKAATRHLAKPDSGSIDNVDHLIDPKRLAGWQQALEAPGMRAVLDDAPWEWFALAELAIEMGDGHLGTKGRLMRPDLFAREAFYDIAAGAAWNGLLLTSDDDRAVTGFAILAHALEVAGDVDGAARVAALVERSYGDPQARAFDHDISFLLRHMGGARRSFAAAPAPVPVVAREIAGWSIACDARRTCLVASTALGARLEIRRPAGPAAPVSIEVVVPEGPKPRPGATPPRVKIDGAPWLGPKAGLDRVATIDRLRHLDVPPLRLFATLEALMAGRVLTVADGEGAGRDASVPLTDLRTALATVDEVQGRAGTATALVKRGGRPGSAVPPPPRVAIEPEPSGGGGRAP